jgi:hypothetical protein
MRGNRNDEPWTSLRRSGAALRRNDRPEDLEAPSRLVGHRQRGRVRRPRVRRGRWVRSDARGEGSDEGQAREARHGWTEAEVDAAVKRRRAFPSRANASPRDGSRQRGERPGGPLRTTTSPPGAQGEGDARGPAKAPRRGHRRRGDARTEGPRPARRRLLRTGPHPRPDGRLARRRQPRAARGRRCAPAPRRAAQPRRGLGRRLLPRVARGQRPRPRRRPHPPRPTPRPTPRSAVRVH